MFNSPPEEYENAVNWRAFLGARMLLHEIGHNFGLRHTLCNQLQGANVCYDTPNYNELFNIYGLDHNINMGACCEIGGDDPWYCSNNLMDYNGGFAISPYQLARWHYDMHKEKLDYIDKDYCTSFLPPQIISYGEDLTWNSQHIFKGDLIIKSGAKLTVRCTFHMPKNAKVIVEPGGELIIDGGCFTNFCGDLWEGIEVQGDRYSDQTPYSNQGYLKIINSGTIENAECGVRLAKNNTYDGWNIDWNSTGGVIQATDAIFQNNAKDVEFLSYHNINDASGTLQNNRSYFKDCHFVVNKELNNGATSLGERLSMFDVEGIRISACVFEVAGEGLSAYSHENRGFGIHTSESGYFLQGNCSVLIPLGGECVPSDLTAQNLDNSTADYIPSRILNFETGIISTSSDGGAPIKVSTTLFDNNLMGARFFNTKSTSFKRNKIILPQVQDGVYDPTNNIWGHMGAQFTGCSSYSIERNVFKGPCLPMGFPDIKTGLNIINSGELAHRVYLNDFEGIFAGTIIQQQNQNQGMGNDSDEGLEILCNVYEDTYYDIAMTDNASVANLQGDWASGLSDIQAPAGNVFEEINDGNERDWFVSSDSDWFVYLHHDQSGSVEYVDPLSVETSDVIKVPQSDVFYTDRLNICPKNPDASSPSGLVLSKIELQRQNIEDLMLDLYETIDGGNTT